MDASQYKDYVLVMLFIKYVSDKYGDKYACQPFAPIQIPQGASFADMVALKGRSDIGDQINKTIIRRLEDANRIVIKADFNDDALLGGAKSAGPWCDAAWCTPSSACWPTCSTAPASRLASSSHGSGSAGPDREDRHRRRRGAEAGSDEGQPRGDCQDHRKQRAHQDPEGPADGPGLLCANVRAAGGRRRASTAARKATLSGASATRCA
jgi:hypothetical protein